MVTLASLGFYRFGVWSPSSIIEFCCGHLLSCVQWDAVNYFKIYALDLQKTHVLSTLSPLSLLADMPIVGLRAGSEQSFQDIVGFRKKSVNESEWKWE